MGILSWIVDCYCYSIKTLLLCFLYNYSSFTPQWSSCCLLCRPKNGKSIIKRSDQSLRLVLIIATLYCTWCVSQIYWRNPPQPAVGEEADLGVLVFLALYFFLPHALCLLSMNQRDYIDTADQLPL